MAAWWDDMLSPWWRARGRKPLPRQAGEMLGLALAQRSLPYHYLGMGLFLRDAPGRPRDYLSARLVNRWQRTVNRVEDAARVDDKLAFFRHAREHGLATAEVVAWTDGAGGVRDAEDRPLDAAARAALLAAHGGRFFAKPRGGGRGLGASILERPEQLEALAAEGGRAVLQPVIAQHPAIARFHPASVNTVRLVTLDGPDGPTIEAAALKMGRGAAIVDNASMGGVFAGVDLGSGRLAPLAGQRLRFGAPRIAAHPDTGIPFAGAAIPFWPETRALVLRGAETLRPLGTLGWDVAITPEGPMIVEANAFWIATLLQIAGGGLAGTRLGRAVLASARGRDAA